MPPRGYFSNHFSTGSFWKKMQCGDHAVQVYRDDGLFLDALEGFVGNGLRLDERVIVVATAGHVHELEKRLRAGGIDVDRLRWQNRYFALLAEESLRNFMVNGWPDEVRFAEFVLGLVGRASGNSRKVRVYGEMVAVLWNRGLYAATLRLEQLWCGLVRSENLLVFCAYPHGEQPHGTSITLEDLCGVHTHIVPG
jgi:hypothetical protein